MIIPKDQIQFRKLIGKSKKGDVWHVKTRGGLHVVSDGSGTILGAGSCGPVAMHLAEQYDPDVTFTELSKSEHVEFQDYEHLLPKYQELTDRMRKLQGK